MRPDNQDRSGIEKATIEGTADLYLRHLEGLGAAAEVAVLNAITVVPRYREDRSFPGDRLRGDVPTVVLLPGLGRTTGEAGRWSWAEDDHNGAGSGVGRAPSFVRHSHCYETLIPHIIFAHS